MDCFFRDVESSGYLEYGASVMIRPALVSDADILHEIEWHSFREQLWDAKDFATFLRRSDSIAYVTLKDHTTWITGYVLGFVSKRTPTYARLVNIAVDSRSRGCGYGFQLLSEFACDARARGCSWVVLEVARSNTAARHLFERFGFGVWKFLPHYYRKNRHALRLRFDLSQ